MCGLTSRGHCFMRGQQRAAFDGAGNALLDFIRGFFQIVVALQIEPPAGARAKVAGEPQRGVGRDGPLAAHDVADAYGCDADGFGERILAEAERHHEIVLQNFARMDRREFLGLHKANACISGYLTIRGFPCNAETQRPQRLPPLCVLCTSALN